MRLATGHALSAEQLFKDFPIKRLKLTAKECYQIMHNNHKERLAAKVWKSCMYLVLNDVIDNSVTFSLPTTKKRAEIFCKTSDGKDFIRGRQHGKWQDVDFLASNFSGAEIVFNYQWGDHMWYKPIYVNRKMRDRITARVNSGKSYY